MNLLFIFGEPQLLTPVSICASGIRLIIEDVNAIADKPGLFLTSQINRSGGKSPNGALTVEKAFAIPSAILFIQLINSLI